MTIDAGGITTVSGSGGLTINTPIVLNSASQTWNNAGATNPLVLNGVVSGNSNVTTSGSVTVSGANTYTGNITVNGGVLPVQNATGLGNVANGLTFQPGVAGKVQAFGVSPTVSTLSGDSTATIENGSATNSTFILATTVANSFNGTFQNGSGGGTLAWRVQGGGSLTFGGTSSATGNVTVRQGKMILTGSIATTPLFTVADTTGLTAQVVMSGGSITSNGVSIGSAGTTGVLVFNSGAITSSGEIWPGTTNNGYGALLMNGGTMTVANFLSVSRSGAGTAGVGILYMTGGDIEVTWSTTRRWGAYNNGAATDGVFKSTATFTGGVLQPSLNPGLLQPERSVRNHIDGSGTYQRRRGSRPIALTDLPTTGSTFNLCASST